MHSTTQTHNRPFGNSMHKFGYLLSLVLITLFSSVTLRGQGSPGAPDALSAPRLDLISVNDEGNAWSVLIWITLGNGSDQWSDGNSPLDEYHVYRRLTGAQDWELIDSRRIFNRGFENYPDTNLTEGIYEYSVSVSNEAGFESELSEISAISVGPHWIRQDMSAFLNVAGYTTQNPVIVYDLFFVDNFNGYALLKESPRGSNAFWRMPGAERSPDPVEFRVLMKTSDGGITWEPIKRLRAVQNEVIPHFNAGWRWLHFTDLSNGTVIGQRTEPLFEWSFSNTENGGLDFSPLEQRVVNNNVVSDIQWDFRPERLRQEQEEFYISDVGHFSNNMIIAGSNGGLIRRLNGGRFQSIALADVTANFSMVNMVSPLRFFLGSRQSPYLWASSNGGINISPLPVPNEFLQAQDSNRFAGIGFKDLQKGLFAGKIDDELHIWKTSNSGRTWGETSLRSVLFSGSSQLRFLWQDDSTVYAASNATSSHPELLLSNDGGQTWIKDGLLPALDRSFNTSNINQSVIPVGNSGRLIFFSGNNTIYIKGDAPQPPGPPTDLAIETGSQNLALTWHPPALQLGIVEYRIQRLLGGEVTETWDQSADEPLELRDSGLENGVIYTYEISARNDAGFGAVATIQGTPISTASRAPDPFSAPRLDLRSVNDEGNAWNVLVWVYLSNGGDQWSDGNSPLDEYHVYRRAVGESNWELLDSRRVLNRGFETYSDRNIPEGVYEYAVSSTNEAGFESELSEPSAIRVGPHWIRQDMKSFLNVAGYTTQNPVYVYDMFFVDSLNGYALLKESGFGQNTFWRMPGPERFPDPVEFRVLMRTSDGGITWEPIKRLRAVQSNAIAHYDASWRWLHFSNLSNGTIIGQRFEPSFEWSFSLTENGGLDFSPLEQSVVNNTIVSDIQWDFRPESLRQEQEEFYINDVGHFGNNLIIAGANGGLIRRLSGGRFQSIALSNLTANFNMVNMVSPQTFFLGSYQSPYLWASSDGGETILTQSAPQPFIQAENSNRFRGIGFNSTQAGLFAGEIDDELHIWKTSNGGQSWNETTILSELNANTSRLRFYWQNSSTVYAASNSRTSHPELLVSTDGGQTWIKDAVLPALDQSVNSSNINQSVIPVGNSGRLIFFTGNDTIYIKGDAPQPPGPPTDLSIEIGSQNLALTWQPPALQLGIVEYRIQRLLGGEVTETWDQSADEPLELRDSGLENGVIYTYEISARNDAGFGAVATIQGTPISTASRAPDPFSAPRLDLRSVNDEGNAWNVLVWVYLSNGGDQWSDGNSPLDEYHVYRRAVGESNWELLDSRRVLNRGFETYSDRNIPEGVYEYAVSSTNEAGFESELSEPSAIRVGPHWIRQDMKSFLNVAGYTTQNPVYVYDMFFVDSLNGYALLKESGFGQNTFWRMPGPERFPDPVEFRVLMRTSDGGITWEPIKRLRAVQSNAIAHYDASWRWLHFSNLSNGTIIGQRFEPSFEWSFSLTENGGLDFSPLEQSVVNNTIVSDIQWDFRPESLRQEQEEFYINDVGHFGNNLIIAGANGGLIRRLSGGRFQSIALSNLTANFNMVNMVSPQTFFLGSYQSPYLWASSDGGETILTQSAPQPFIQAENSNRFRGIGFNSTQAGLFAGEIDDELHIWKTSNGGQSWNETTILSELNANTSRLRFYWQNSSTVYAASNSRTSHPELLVSTDGGQTWIKDAVLPALDQSVNSSNINQSVIPVGNSGRLIFFTGNDTIYHSDLAAQTPILPAPSDFIALPEIGGGGIQLSWSHPDPLEIDGFELIRFIEGEKRDPIKLSNDIHAYLDEEVSPGQKIVYQLKAVKGTRKSDSVSIEITIPEPPSEPLEPRIIRQALSVMGPKGSTVQLFVEADGDSPLEYTWYFNGQVMPDATQASIQISNLSNEDVGIYEVVVSNPVDEASSAPMKVLINPANLGGVDSDWNARFESAEGFNSRPVGVYHHGNGGALVAGEFTPTGSNNSDFIVIEYDGSGKQTWATRVSFNDTSSELARKSVLDHQGNVIVGGSTLVNPADLVDEITPDLPKRPIELTFLASVDPSGKTNWTYTQPVDFERELQILDLQLDNSGKLYLMGNIRSEAYNGVIIQTLSSNNGNVTQTMLADDKTRFIAIAMAVANNGRIYLAGNSNETTGNASGLQIRCYGSNGRLDWKTDLGSIGVTQFTPTTLHLHESGGVYVVGISNNPDTAEDIHVVRFDSNGTGEWQNKIGLDGNAKDILVASRVDKTGALIVAGDSAYPGGHTQIVLGKFKTDGNSDWSTVLPLSMPNVSDRVTNMDLDSSGDIYLSAVRHAPTTGQDFASFKFDSNGALIWEASFKQEGFAIEEATHIDADDSGNVILSGITFLENQQQIVTIRQKPLPPIVNALPELAFKTFKNPVIIPGQRTVELKAKDPDGEIVKVEFLEGSRVLATDTDAPYTMSLEFDTPTETKIFARAFDNLGGVAISEALEIKAEELTSGPPINVLQPTDFILPKESELTLDFGITGSDPINYEWFLNGEKLKGANQATLPIIPHVTRENSGSYELRAENSEGILKTEQVIVSLDWQIVDGADQFEDAVEIGGDSGELRTSNVDATVEIGEPRHSDKRSSNTIWYRWRPASSGLATLSLQGSSFDTLLAVYTGNSLTQLKETEIESDDDRGGFSTSRLQFNAFAGVDYMIAIGGFNGANGNILFSWKLDAAQLVRIPRITFPDKRNTVNFGEDYQFSPDIIGDLQGIQLQWFHNGAPIPGATGETLVIESAQPGDAGAYWITIDAGGNSGRTKTARLTVNIPLLGKTRELELVPEEKFADLFFFVRDNNPRLRNFAQRFRPQAFGSPFRTTGASLATGFTGAQIFNTFGATKEVGEPDHCGIPGGASQWFAYQAPADGELTITTDGSDFDTVMAVYTSTGSSFENLTEVACDNDSGADGQDSTVTFTATEGTVYYIAVDGVEAATGTVNLAYELEVGLEVQSVTIAENGMQFQIQTVPNITFVIEGTEDFITWDELISTSSLDGSFIFLDNEALIGTQRFYRVYLTE